MTAVSRQELRDHLRAVTLKLQIDCYLTRQGAPSPGWLDGAMHILAVCQLAALEHGLRGDPRQADLQAGMAAGVAVARAGWRWQQQLAPAMDAALAAALSLRLELPDDVVQQAMQACRVV